MTDLLSLLPWLALLLFMVILGFVFKRRTETSVRENQQIMQENLQLARARAQLATEAVALQREANEHLKQIASKPEKKP